MKIELNNDTETMLESRFPSLRKAADVVYNISGVSLADMRRKSRLAILVEARAMFFMLCISKVNPRYYIASYLGYDHSTSTNWISSFSAKIDSDTHFKNMWLRAKEEFSKL